MTNFIVMHKKGKKEESQSSFRIYESTLQMLKCSANGRGFHSYYWKPSFSKALSADSKQFSTVSQCFAMCFRDRKDKTQALGNRHMNYLISSLHTWAACLFFIEWFLIKC